MSTVTGTDTLVRTTCRRDRTRLTVWVASLAGLVVAAASSVQRLYPTQADLDRAAAASADSAIARAFKGPPLALATEGGQVAFQIMVFGAVGVALMSLLTTARLTRGEEEAGRLEVVRALPVGRRAPLVAALVVVAGMDVVVGILVVGGLVALGLPALGAATVGASLALVGITFAAVTAVTAQVSENARVASGIAGALLAASFVGRAVGDVGDGAVSWLSPIGWAQKARPFADEQAWPLLLPILLTVGCVTAAIALLDRRDVGAGLLAPRPGPARAAPGLRSTTALAMRLQRGGVLWWGAGVVGLGVAYGSIAGSIDSFVDGNESIEDVIARGGGDLLDAFLATSLLIMALVACGFAVQSVLRLRAEEAGGRAEVLLATPTSRVRWAAGHAGIAFAGSALALVLGGVALGVLAGLTAGDHGDIARVTAAAVAYVPGVWVVTAIAVGLVGLVPRWAALAWAPLAVCAVFGMFGTLLDIPQAVLDISPFELTPRVPAAAWDAVPIVALLAVAVAVTAGGLTALRQRDLTT